MPHVVPEDVRAQIFFSLSSIIVHEHLYLSDLFAESLGTNSPKTSAFAVLVPVSFFVHSLHDMSVLIGSDSTGHSLSLVNPAL